MNKKKWFFVFCLFIAFTAFLPAQTASEIEKLLDTKALCYEDAVLFILLAADIPDAVNSVSFGSSEAFRLARDRQWLPKKAAPGNEARLDGISLLIMRAFDMKGGLFFTLFKNPHYAYRELVYREVIQGKADPGMEVSGVNLLFFINRIFTILEN